MYPSHLRLKKISLAVLSSLSLLIIPTLSSSTFASPSTETTTESPAAPATNVENPLAQLDWHIGPKTENIASVAQLKTLQNEGFLDPKNSDKFLELTNNLPSGSSNILVAKDDSWWATFDFDASGYVKDNETIDADALLKDLKANDEASNAERERLGLPKLYTEGWSVAPHYDAQTKRLEWGLIVKSEDQSKAVNYTVRLLGRSGVVSATLVSDEEHLPQNITAFKQSLNGFDFNAGQHYAEYREGDKVAEYGLAALITGGAVAVAAKKGFFATILLLLAKFWKLIVIGAIALGGGFTSLFKRKK